MAVGLLTLVKVEPEQAFSTKRPLYKRALYKRSTRAAQHISGRIYGSVHKAAQYISGSVHKRLSTYRSAHKGCFAPEFRNRLRLLVHNVTAPSGAWCARK